MAGVQLLALATFLGAAVYAHAGVQGARRARDGGATHETAVFLLLGATLAVFALRQALPPLSRPSLDVSLYQALYVPAAMSVVVLMHMTASKLTRSKLLPLGAAGLFMVLAATVVAYVFGADFGDQAPRDWMSANEEAASVLFGFFTFPALTAAGLLVFAAHQIGGEDARRIRLASLSCAVFYLAFTIDAVDARAVGAVALSALMVLAAGLAHLAFFPRPWMDILDPRLDEGAPDEQH
jgi:hypothetical protein